MTVPRRPLVAVPGAALLAFLAIAAAAPPARRDFEFTYAATVDHLPRGAKKVALWIPYPETDAHQTITDVEVRCPYPARVTKDPEYGNRALYVEVSHPKVASFDVEVSFDVERKEYVRRGVDEALDTTPHSRSAPARYLQDDRLVPLNERIRTLAAEVVAGRTADLDRARAIFEYVVANMKYDKSGTGWGNGDILWACDARRGNCTDFHALFIGLCRAVGIPARFSIGFQLPVKRGAGEIPGYHCWAEFFLKGYGWVPVDASEAALHPERKEYYFGAHDENRVQLSTGRDIVLSPRQVGSPLNYFVYPYAEVDGVPFRDLTRRFTFRDRIVRPVANAETQLSAGG